MKTKFRNYSLAACLAAVIVLCPILGTGFLKSPSEASADGIETYASAEDVTETIEAETFAEGVTYESDEGVYFEYDGESGGFVVTGHTEGCVSAVLPDSVTVESGGSSHTYPVVRIEDKAFYNDTLITAIRVGKYVEYVGSHAFYGCYGAESLEYLAADAENGGDSTNYAPFYYAGYTAGKNKLVVGADVERIDEYMFYYTYVSEVTFAEGSRLKEVGKYAFYKVQGVSSDTVIDFMLPETLETVGDEAFETYVAIKNANVPENIKEVGKRSFAYRDLEYLHFEAVNFPESTSVTNAFQGLGRDMRMSGSDGWVMGKSNGVTVYIGKKVEKIPAYCFAADTPSADSRISQSCGAYITYVYPEYRYEGGADDGGYALTYIGEHAFDNLYWLSACKFPMGLDEVAPYAFSGSNVSKITLGDTDGWYAENDDGSSVSATVQVLFAAEFMSDPSTVATYWKTTYPSYRFRWTDGFSYKLSADGTYYVVSAYTGDGGEVTVRDTYRAKPVKEIGSSAFKSKTAVTSVVIPESVEKIGASAFYGCTKLASVTLRGSGLKEVGSNAFYNCSALKSLYVSSASAFVSADYDGRYANPLALVSSNKGTFYVGGDSYTTLSINGTDRIGTYALAYCTIITSVTIGDSVETIADCAFYGETSLSSIAIPSSVTYIGADAFSSMSLSTVTFAGNSGWTVTSGSTEIKLAASELQSNAKDFLTSTYAKYVWTRTVYDHSAPAIECTIENGGYTNGDIVIYTTVDQDSAIDYILYVTPDGAEVKVSAMTLTLYAKDLSCGLYVFYAVDEDGLESEEYRITFDDVSPEIYATGSDIWGGYVGNGFSVYVKDEGDLSPVTLYYSTDGVNFVSCGGDSFSVTPSGDSGNDGKYWFAAEDAAGNKVGAYWIVLDTLAPYGEWDFTDDLSLYFSWDAPSYTTWTCTVNGKAYTSGTTYRDETTYTAVLTSPTGLAGTVTYRLEHAYEEEYVEATCSQSAYWLYTCVYCGDVFTELDPYSSSGEHAYELIVEEPTCTEPGYSEYVCADCGAATGYSYIAPLGHLSVAGTYTAPTCTSDGYSETVCSRCGEKLSGETITRLGHEFIHEYIDATCTEPARTVTTCSRCDEYYVEELSGDALGHDYIVTEYEAPDCESAGRRVFVCEACGDTYLEELPALDHSTVTTYVKDENGDTWMYVECSRCGNLLSAENLGSVEETASNGVIEIFRKYQDYMWWILLAFVAVWSIFIGLRWALARNSEEKAKSHSMLANYIIGLFVIAIILVGLPYLIYGIAVLVA